jgi:segregation and condensation protein B
MPYPARGMTHPDTPTQDTRLLEALLFASARPLTGAEIAVHLPQGADVAAALEAVRARYAGGGVEVVVRDGAYALRTAPDLAGRLEAVREAERPLPRAALETLAIIAYHQPATRPEIEAIRGVSVGRATLDTLIAAGWIKPGRRRPTPGRPATWVTTPAFLDHFGLASLDDLPDLAELKAAGLVGAGAGPGLFEGTES